jgi:glycosyltransferase involved in cell wall biosynthesis
LGVFDGWTTVIFGLERIDNNKNMESTEKKISILLAVYNAAEYIGEAIESVLLQSYSNWELIIVNNGSTDNTQSIIEKFSQINPKIKYYYTPTKGKVKAYNFAFTKTTGEAFCFFAGDDILTNDSLEKRIVLLKNKDDVATCRIITFSEDKKYTGLVFPQEPKIPNYSGGCVMFQKELANKIFPIPDSLPNEDTWTMIHIKTWGNIVHSPELLYNYRIHQNMSYGYQLSYDAKRNGFIKRMEAYPIFYQKYKNENIKFVEEEIKHFCAAYKNFIENKVYRIVLFRNIGWPEKIKYVLFSSRLLFYLRYNVFFKLLTGSITQ